MGTSNAWIWPTFRGYRGQNGQIKFWDKQSGTNRNRCTQTLVILHALAHDPSKPTLIARTLIDFWAVTKNLGPMCSTSGTCGPPVTKFASWVHLTWMQTAEYLWFDLLFRVTRGKYVLIKFWDNHGGTSRNRCTQRLVILHTQTH